MRQAHVVRNTTETQIDLELNLDGTGQYDIQTGCGFLNHMLELFTRHGSFDIKLRCHGDTHVDYHHSAEDTGIALGQAFLQALDDKKGIYRYGYMILPMDEALILTAVDISEQALIHQLSIMPSYFITIMDSLKELYSKNKSLQHRKDLISYFTSFF